MRRIFAGSKKVLTLALIALFVASFFSGVTLGAEAENGDPYISLDKEAEEKGCCRGYEVTLTVTGNPPEAPVDVILVIDRSGSMNYGSPTALYYTKQAAKDFAADVLAGSNNRVGVVSYNGPRYFGALGQYNNSKLEVGLTPSLSSVNNAIDGIVARYGTNIQAGFRRAWEHMDAQGRPEATKAIVLMTDGVATASIGNPAGPNDPDDHNAHTIAAYTEGQVAQGYATVFTVGLLSAIPAVSVDVARETLLWSASDPDYYYETYSAPDLSDIYDTIAGQLVAAATNAVVTDVVSAEFELVAGTLNPSQGSASAVVNGDGTTTITWNVGTVNSSDVTLTYEIKVKAGELPDGQDDVDTNDSASMAYTDVSGASRTSDFPVPAVDVPPVIKADAGPDKGITAGDSVQIGGSPTASGGYGGYTYSWTCDTSGWTSSEANPTVSPSETTEYTVVVKDKYDCTDSDSMTVTVRVPTGSITVVKSVYDAVYGNLPHPGVYFTVSQVVYSGVGYTDTQPTGVDGTVRFNVPLGIYTLSEEVPPCYITDLDETEQYDLSNGSDITVYVYNEPYDPGIDLDKTGPCTAMPGETIKYYLTVSNTGNIPLEVYLDDPVLGIEHRYLGTYGPGDSDVIEEDYAVPGDASGSIENTAMVTGYYDCPLFDQDGLPSVVDEDSHEVEIVEEFVPDPRISIVKTGPATSRPGKTITYEFTVTNTGNMDLYCVKVTDPFFGESWEKFIGELAVGEKFEFEEDYKISNSFTGTLKNTATVVGHYFCEEYLPRTFVIDNGYSNGEGEGCDLPCYVEDSDSHSVKVRKSTPSPDPDPEPEPEEEEEVPPPPPAAEPEPEVEVITVPPAADLPKTGGSTMPLAYAGSALLLLGWYMRRRTR